MSDKWVNIRMNGYRIVYVEFTNEGLFSQAFRRKLRGFAKGHPQGGKFKEVVMQVLCVILPSAAPSEIASRVCLLAAACPRMDIWSTLPSRDRRCSCSPVRMFLLHVLFMK